MCAGVAPGKLQACDVLALRVGRSLTSSWDELHLAGPAAKGVVKHVWRYRRAIRACMGRRGHHCKDQAGVWYLDNVDPTVT
jgi:hypothetical protein